MAAFMCTQWTYTKLMTSWSINWALSYTRTPLARKNTPTFLKAYCLLNKLIEIWVIQVYM